MSHDESKVRRGQPKNRAQFREFVHSNPESQLTAPTTFDKTAPSKLAPSIDGYQKRHQYDYASTLAALDGSPNGALDLFVDSIDEGHLSRGTPGNGGVNAVLTWLELAEERAKATGDHRYDQFTSGVHQATLSLFPGETTAVEFEESALTRARTKRATAHARGEWRRALQHAGEHEQRGMLVAAAALSHTDSWWGFRDDTDRTILGD